MEAVSARTLPQLRIGAHLLATGLITAEQLADALDEKERTGARIGEIVVRNGWVSAEALARTLARQSGLEYCDVEATGREARATDLLSPKLARYFRCVPLRILDDRTVLVAVADPWSPLLEDLPSAMGYDVRITVASEDAIDRIVDELDPAGAGEPPLPPLDLVQPLLRLAPDAAPVEADDLADAEAPDEPQPDAQAESEPAPIPGDEPSAAAPLLIVVPPEPAEDEAGVEEASPAAGQELAPLGDVAQPVDASPVVESDTWLPFEPATPWVEPEAPWVEPEAPWVEPMAPATEDEAASGERDAGPLPQLDASDAGWGGAEAPMTPADGSPPDAAVEEERSDTHAFTPPAIVDEPADADAPLVEAAGEDAGWDVEPAAPPPRAGAFLWEPDEPETDATSVENDPLEPAGPLAEAASDEDVDVDAAGELDVPSDDELDVPRGGAPAGPLARDEEPAVDAGAAESDPAWLGSWDNDVAEDASADDPAEIEHDETAATAELDAAAAAYDPSVVESFEEAHGGPAAPFVEEVLRRAIAAGASDVHFEPRGGGTLVRMRVDGVMHDLESVATELEQPVAAQLEAMGDPDLAEGRTPQEGRVTADIGGRSVDLRIAVLPTIHGEQTVVRILQRTVRALDLSELGLAGDTAALLRHALAQPSGIVLAVGPAGSGTTTTLHAALRLLDSPGRCLVTVEDPVEYQLDGVSQIEVDTRAGLPFATGLRTALRSDPDVLLVGGLHDGETARIAVEAAMTGHLVLSTLHADNVASAVSRLLDMGVERQLLASSLNCVLAQRLARRLCTSCRTAVETRADELVEAGADPAAVPSPVVTLYAPSGCDRCRGGFKGRVGLFEALPATPSMRRLVESATAAEIYERAVSGGMRPLQTDGLRLCLEGLTSLDEIRRVAGDRRI